MVLFLISEDEIHFFFLYKTRAQKYIVVYPFLVTITYDLRKRSEVVAAVLQSQNG